MSRSDAMVQPQPPPNNLFFIHQEKSSHITFHGILFCRVDQEEIPGISEVWYIVTVFTHSSERQLFIPVYADVSKVDPRDVDESGIGNCFDVVRKYHVHPGMAMQARSAASSKGISPSHVCVYFCMCACTYMY